MKKTLAVLSALALLSISVFLFTLYAPEGRAQSGRYDSWAVDSNNHFIANATVRVCSYSDPWKSSTAYVTGNTVTYSGGYYTAVASSTGVTPGTDVTKWNVTSCPTASIYSDKDLTVSQANPFTADSLGNYGFWAAPGSYLVSVNGYVYPVVIAADARTAMGMYHTSPSLDPGLNECQAINKAWAWATSKGYTAVRIFSEWHGVQACGTSDPNATYPSAINANPPTFAVWLDLLPDNVILSDQSVVLRTNQHWDFHAPHTSLVTALTGTFGGFAASSIFTGTGAVVEFGAPDGTSLSSGGQPQGVQLENAGVYGYLPGGTWRAGSICVRNQYAQENSWGRNLHIDGCQYGIDKQDTGTGFGSINDGPWEELHINLGGCNSVDCRIIRVGKGNVANTDVSNARGFYHVSGNISGALVQPTAAISVNGAGITFQDIHLEQFPEGFALGDLGFAKNIMLYGPIECDGTVAKPFTTCVHIYNTNEFGNTYGNTIMGVNSTGNITNLLVDDRSGGGTATWAGSGTVAFYTHTLGGTVISSTSEIPSRMTFATGTALSSLNAPIANAVFAMNGFKLELDGSASQATSILSIQGQASNTNAIPLLNVTTGSATEKAFSFCTAGKGCIATDASNNLQLTNTQTATSGANFGSPTIFVQGRYWTGSASSGEGVTQGLTYGSGGNPATTYSFALAGAGTGEHRFDLSNWAKVFAKNISTGTASNTDLAGQVTLSSGSATYTFAQTYTSAPICVATDTTAAAAVKASATTTVLTLTGTSTDVINYHCVGRN